jgi:hypothetical protein
MTSIDESHDRSVKVIEEYNNEGKPFVLYLRKFSFNVWHGKDDINRYLTDNYIESNLPQGVNLISIQEPGDSMTFFRKVPSLHLTDTSWQCVVEEPIKIADIIVSECYMLSPRVTYEMTNCIRLLTLLACCSVFAFFNQFVYRSIFYEMTSCNRNLE